MKDEVWTDLVESAKACVLARMRAWEIGRTSVYLAAALTVLIAARGDEWIQLHSHVLRDEPQPLHAASFRAEDCLRYSQVCVVSYGSHLVYLRPEDGKTLASK